METIAKEVTEVESEQTNDCSTVIIDLIRRKSEGSDLAWSWLGCISCHLSEEDFIKFCSTLKDGEGQIFEKTYNKWNYDGKKEELKEEEEEGEEGKSVYLYAKWRLKQMKKRS